MAGDAATAALVRAEKDLQRLLQVGVMLQGMTAALNSGGAQLSPLRTHILSTAAQATALGGPVSDDGSVQPAGFGELMTPATAGAYTALLTKLLETFDAVDEATASALTTAAAPQAPPNPAMPQIPEQGIDPQQVKQWWDSLRPEERQRLAGEQPERIGNLEADNTTVLVPGTGNSVSDRNFGKPDGLNVYHEMQSADPAKKNSVVLWMGYDAPDSPTDLRIAQTDLARHGGSLLAPDVNAFDVTNGAKDAHVTVIGHSYGSTTVADAAAGHGMRTDDVVLIGPPGTDLAKSAADFHLPSSGHVCVGAASSDPVTTAHRPTH